MKRITSLVSILLILFVAFSMLQPETLLLAKKEATKKNMVLPVQVEFKNVKEEKCWDANMTSLVLDQYPGTISELGGKLTMSYDLYIPKKLLAKESACLHVGGGCDLLDKDRKYYGSVQFKTDYRVSKLNKKYIVTYWTGKKDKNAKPYATTKGVRK